MDLQLNMNKDNANTLVTLDMNKERLSNVRIQIEWAEHKQFGADPERGFDLDLCAAITDRFGKIQDKSQFVYFNNKNYGNFVALPVDNRTGGVEWIDIALAQSLPSVGVINLFATVFQYAKRGQHFGNMYNCRIKVIDFDTDRVVQEYVVDAVYSGDSAIHIGNFVRNGTNWEFKPGGSGQANVDIQNIVNMFV